MVSKELQENNIVYFELETGDRIIVAVLTVYDNSVDLYRNEERFYKVPLDKIFPIPLDQNWLNLFGYVEHPRLNGYQWVPKYTVGFMHGGRFYIDHDNGTIFIVDYVHSLQNYVAFLLRNNLFGPRRLKNPDPLP